MSKFVHIDPSVDDIDSFHEDIDTLVFDFYALSSPPIATLKSCFWSSLAVGYD